MKNKTSTIISLAAALSMAVPVLGNAAQQETLNVYTYSSFASKWGPGPKIEANFEKQCACDLQFIALDDGVSVLNRLRLEGKSSQADVILGLDDSLMATAKSTGLLSQHNIDVSALQKDLAWQDDTFVPFDFGYFAFVYDSEKLTNPPKSLRELVESRDDIKVIYQDPRTSTPGLGLLLWMQSVYGDDVGGAWQQLSKKTVTVTKGWSEAYNMFLAGEADMVLSYSTSPAYHIIAEGKQQYKSANFSEGHYQQTEVAAIVKNAPNKALATQFMRFMLTEGFQGEIATGNWMYPVTDVKLPTEFGQLATPVKALSFSSEEVEKQRNRWTKQWLISLTY